MGLAASIPLGPVGVVCVQRTINKGRISGFFSGLGAATTDTIFAAIGGLCLTFIIGFIEAKQQIIELAGGIIIILLGLRTFYTNPVTQLKRHKKKPNTLVEDFISMFLLTGANPFTIFLFIALFAALGIVTKNQNLLFTATALVGVFLGASLWWFTLSSLVNLFRHKFRLKQLWWMNKITGSIIFILGIIAIVGVVNKAWFGQLP